MAASRYSLAGSNGHLTFYWTYVVGDIRQYLKLDTEQSN